LIIGYAKKRAFEYTLLDTHKTGRDQNIISGSILWPQQTSMKLKIVKGAKHG